MRCLNCVIILSLVTILLWLPLPAIALPLPTIPATSDTPVAQISAEDFSQAGVDKMLSQDYAGAIENFIQAIRLDPNNAKTYSNLGLARANLGDQIGAISEFSQALHLNPELSTAYYNRGFIRSKLQDYQGALLDLNSAIRLNPQDADAYQCRYFVRYTLGQQGVIEDLHQAAQLYLDQGKLEEYQGVVNTINQLQKPTNFLGWERIPI